MVNNMVCLSNISPAYAKTGQLISVSLKDGVKDTESDLPSLIRKELMPWIPSAQERQHIKTYSIRYALPSQSSVNNNSILKVDDRTTIIGDHTMNGSINAAMKSGRLGAERILS